MLQHRHPPVDHALLASLAMPLRQLSPRQHAGDDVPALGVVNGRTRIHIHDLCLQRRKCSIDAVSWLCCFTRFYIMLSYRFQAGHAPRLTPCNNTWAQRLECKVCDDNAFHSNNSVIVALHVFDILSTQCSDDSPTSRSRCTGPADIYKVTIT